MQAADVSAWWPKRPADGHKWNQAVRVIAGSPAMTGAALLASHAAMRAGAGMVSLSVPGQLVQRRLAGDRPAGDPARRVVADGARVAGAVQGRGRRPGPRARRRHGRRGPAVRRRGAAAGGGRRRCAVRPGVERRGRRAACSASGARPTVLTPHDGEYKLLTGHAPAADRLVAARRLAADTGCVVLLKGPATVIAEPHGQTLVVTAGDSRLATAGTGDVLAGIIGALLAAGLPPAHAAAAGAWVHGQAARRGPRLGFVASDLRRPDPARDERLPVIGPSIAGCAS